jgi:hypothetical protein
MMMIFDTNNEDTMARKNQETQGTQETQETPTPMNANTATDFSIFDDPNYTSNSEELFFPAAALMNDRDYGLFIPNSSLVRVGYTGETEGFEYIRQYSNGSTEPGIRLTSAEICVVGTSPRLIEWKPEDGVHPITGQPLKRGSLVGNYETIEGKRLYEHIKSREAGMQLVTLRNFYGIFLVSERQPLHAIPLCLSVQGIAGISLNQALDDWRVAVSTAYANVRNRPFQMMSQKFYALNTIKLNFAVEKRGTAKKNDVCVVESVEKVTEANFAQSFLGFDPKVRSSIEGMSLEFEKFVARMTETAEGPVKALAPAHQEGLETILIEAGEDFATGEDAIPSVAVSAEVA